MLLAHDPPKCKRFGGASDSGLLGLGRGFERQRAMVVLIHAGLAVTAAGAAGLGANSQRLVNDGLDSARTAAAFGAAAEAAVNLLGAARKVVR